MSYGKECKVKTDSERMSEIQDRLVEFMSTELHTDEDFMYMATMLLKHSMVLYKTFLEDDAVRDMLAHVADNIEDTFSLTDLADEADDDTSGTLH